MDPSIATPLASRPSVTAANPERQRPISAPGKRGLTASPASMIASTPKPIANVQRLAAPARSTRDKACSASEPCDAATPSTDGACEIRMWPAMPTKEAGRHRNGQKISDEAEAQRARANKDQPDHDAERRCGRSVMGRSGRREHSQRADEDRRDRRIRPYRKPPAVAEQSKPNRGRDQGKQADLGREVREASGRHLRGDCDGRQRQAGDGVGAEITGTPASE